MAGSRQTPPSPRLPRRRARRALRRWAGLAAALVLAGVALRFAGRTLLREPLRPDTDYRISRVFDGDTIELEGMYVIRLLGVDTPESWPCRKLERDAARLGLPESTVMEMGRRADAFVSRLCEGRKARIAFDPVNAPRRHRDIYGRILAYVFLVDPARPGEEPLFLNRKLVAYGYSRRSNFDFGYRDEWRGLEERARERQYGLWKFGPLP